MTRPSFTHCFSDFITAEQDEKIYQLYEHTHQRFKTIDQFYDWLKRYGMEGVELLHERFMYAVEIRERINLDEKRLEEIEALYGIKVY